MLDRFGGGWRRCAIVGATLVAAAGCTTPIALPPMNPSGSGGHDVGRFVWYDLLTDEPEGVERFYSGLLGWSFEKTADPRYSLIRFKGVPIGGAVDVSGRHDVDVSQWVALLSVADVDRAAATVRGDGGEVHVGPKDVAQRGRLAVVSDPQGALLGLVRARGGDPPARPVSAGDFFWTELWASDSEAAIGFYEKLGGYRRSERQLSGESYLLLERDDQPRAGVIDNPIAEIRPHWLPYVRVEDPRAVVAEVDRLGGRVLLAPREDIRGGSVAIVVDPGGAAVALQAPID